MADSSLDDFFAKKDKTKKKTKTKGGASGDVDDGASKPTKKDKKKKDKDKQNQSGGTTNILSNPQEDEEWKDFEEEKEVDYSGLRIQTLQIGKGDQDRDGDDDENGDDEDGENKERRDTASGPWNKSNMPTSAAAAPAPISQPEPAKEESSTPKAPAKYVPPAQRHAAQSASSTPSFPSSRKKKEAPNVNSEEDFPTLGGGPAPGKAWSQQYSSTASSDLIDNPNQRKGVNLSLENKFSALQD